MNVDIEACDPEQEEQQDDVKTRAHLVVYSQDKGYLRNALIHRKTGKLHSPWWVDEADAYAYEPHEATRATQLADGLGAVVVVWEVDNVEA